MTLCGSVAAGRRSWKFLKFWKYVDLHRSPVEATSKYCDSIFPVRILRIRTYLPCNWEGIDRHSLATVVCQLWMKYRWNLVIAGQNVLFWRGSIKRLDLHMTYRYRAETFRIYLYRLRLPSWVDTRYDLMRVSHSGALKLKIPEIFKHVDLHQSPVSREPPGLRSPYSLCVPCVHLPTHSVNGKALACIV